MPLPLRLSPPPPPSFPGRQANDRRQRRIGHDVTTYYSRVVTGQGIETPWRRRIDGVTEIVNSEHLHAFFVQPRAGFRKHLLLNTLHVATNEGNYLPTLVRKCRLMRYECFMQQATGISFKIIKMIIAVPNSYLCGITYRDRSNCKQLTTKSMPRVIAIKGELAIKGACTISSCPLTTACELIVALGASYPVQHRVQ